MKNIKLVLANLIQKIALWKTKFNRAERLEEHIRMLDWVVSPYETTREIEQIVKDEDYDLSPNEYVEKYS